MSDGTFEDVRRAVHAEPVEDTQNGEADLRCAVLLEASEQRYRNLIHHLPFALLQVDSTAMLPIFERLSRESGADIRSHLEGDAGLPALSRAIVRVTDANLKAVSLFGADDVADLIAPVEYLFAVAPETAVRVIRAHFEGRRSHSELMKLRRFDGQVIDVEIGVTYPRPPDRLEVTLITLVDVSERLRTEAQLRHVQAEFTRAARVSMLGEMAASIAHEVNQPLSAIVTNAETSMRWLDRDTPNIAKVQELTGRIAESGRRASDIVKRIRSMAVRRSLEPVPLNFNDVVTEALTFVCHDFETRKIRVVRDLARGLPPVLGDRVQLQQVIVNLLVNAQQAFVPGDAAPVIEISTAITDADGLVMQVKDNGPGIPGLHLNRVFDSFFTTKPDGVGIGLAICQSIIVAHGGRLSARNRPQGGAALCVCLPTPALGEGAA